MEQIEKPLGLEPEHLEFLDNLRESGIVNMFGAHPYLADEFNISEEAARMITAYWMKTFSDRHK